MPPSLVLAAMIAALAPVQKASPAAAAQPVQKASPSAAAQPVPKASLTPPAQPVQKASLTPPAQPVQKASLTPAADPAPALSARSPAGDPAQPARRFTALVLRNEGIALDGLAAALALRIPDLPVVSESPRDGAPFVFIAVRSDPATPVRHQLGVITSDGAAYFRDVDTGADPPARVLASVLANLLVSIAEGSVQPDRTDVPIPPPETPLPAPKPEPIPAAPPPEPTPKPVPKASPVPSPRWDYGLVLAGLVDLAGPPRFGAVLGGGGGSLGLDIRGRQGALLGLELRGLGRGVAGRSLFRLRVAALAGYALRRGRFELPIALGLSVEPWWVDPTITNRPLLGALLRASPGLYLARPRGPLRALRIGPRVELAGSFIVDDGPRVAAISQAGTAGNTPQIRLGGLEINLGLELTLWLGRPARAPSPARSQSTPHR